MNNITILNDFDSKRELYNNFETKIVILIKELLHDNVEYHHISSRVKDHQSLEKKIEKKERKYLSIDEVTDVVGCRIISFFEDDVDKIVNILQGEFNVDINNSVNKKEMIEPEKFGYVSYHIVCSINDKRLELAEYKRYKGLKFEIQIRSILQHAWAEIEHDLGYKSSSDVPKEIRRKFSRIAGLLETADENFCEIKQSLEQYNNKINNNEEELLNTDLNLNSLTLFTKNTGLVLEIDEFISSIKKFDLLDDTIDNEKLSYDLKRLSYFNITTIKDLNDLLLSKKEIIQDFAREIIFIKNSKEEMNSKVKFSIGISYFYLSYILMLENESVEFQKNYLETMILKNASKLDIDMLFENLQATYNKVK